MLSARQKPNKLNAIARKRDLQKYTDRQYQNLGHTVYITHFLRKLGISAILKMNEI
jgi:hypothetical protein